MQTSLQAESIKQYSIIYDIIINLIILKNYLGLGHYGQFQEEFGCNWKVAISSWFQAQEPQIPSRQDLQGKR